MLCLDPERIRSSRIAANVFPQGAHRLQGHHAEGVQATRSTSSTARDGGASLGNIERPAVRTWTTTSGEVARGRRPTRSRAAADNELVKLVNKVIVDAYNQGASDIHIEPYPGKAKTEIRFRKDGIARALHRGAGELPRRARGAPQDHVRPGHLREAQAAGRQDQVQEVRPARHRAARRHHSHRRRRRGHRDAHPRRRRADPARQAGLLAAQPRAAASTRSPSPTACSSSAARPARARPPRCTRCSSP